MAWFVFIELFVLSFTFSHLNTMERNGSVRLLGRSLWDCIIAFAVSLLHMRYWEEWGTQLPKSPLSQLHAFTAGGGQDRNPLPPGWVSETAGPALAVPAWPGSAGDKDWRTPVCCISLLSRVRPALGTPVIPGMAVDACRAGSQAWWTA